MANEDTHTGEQSQWAQLEPRKQNLIGQMLDFGFSLEGSQLLDFICLLIECPSSSYKRC